MRRWLAVLTMVVLALAVSVGAMAAPSADQGKRILLSAGDAASVGIAARHNFGAQVTAHVPEAVLDMLTAKGIAFEVVPEVSIYAAATPQGKPGGGTTRVLPSTQVPYGIKMIYGNPSLTPGAISGGNGVTVAVLDTGSVNHPDFTRQDGSKVITGCVDFSNTKNPQVEGSCTDGHGHGTHVTGTIAGAGGVDGKGVFGVAPNASVFSYKVLNDRGSGYADDIATAIRVAADRGANIISMSLGSSTGSSLELDAIRYAVGKGVLVVCAAGNDGPNANTIGYPGAYKEAVAVAALNPDEVVAYFSSRGTDDGNDASIVDREVEVAGPGRSTISTYKDGGYATMSGTSMATPHIAGLSAKMWQGSADRTRTWLRSQAQAHDITRAEQINNAGAGYDIAAGYGLPQVQTLAQSLWNN